jgi:hypothetical protein
MAKKPVVEIPEAKIRQVIWMQKQKKTKKDCCEHLGIAYNTKRLEKIIEDFRAGEDRVKRLKAAAKTKILTKSEKENIAKEYLNGATQSGIAADYFISPQRIKKILIETGTPIRGRGKNSAPTVDHIVQDLEVKFTKKERVFIAKHNCFGTVMEVYDEDYLEYLETGRQRYVDIREFKPNPKTGMAGKFYEPEQGVHFEIYWSFSGGEELKMRSMLEQRSRINKVLEDTGREHYLVWREDDYKGFMYLCRDDLYPVKAA